MGTEDRLRMTLEKLRRYRERERETFMTLILRQNGLCFLEEIIDSASIAALLLDSFICMAFFIVENSAVIMFI